MTEMPEISVGRGVASALKLPSMDRRFWLKTEARPPGLTAGRKLAALTIAGRLEMRV
jgi:hypothetical protein